MTSVTDNGQIEFRFFRRDVNEVRILGSFAVDGLPMQSVGDGWWTAIACFRSGEYRFKYQADGELFPDYAANGLECVKSGVQSVLVVPASDATRALETQEMAEQNNKIAMQVA